MEIKTNQPAGRPAEAGEPEKIADSLLKQQINIFLINYFGYLTLALALIIFAAGLFLFIYPKYRQITEDRKTADVNSPAGYEDKDSYLSAINDLKNSYGLISEADRKKIEDMVPVGSDIVGLIPKIESIALKNGAVLNSIKIGTGALNQPNAGAEAGSASAPEPPAGIFGPLPQGVGLGKIEIDLSSVNYPVLKNLLKTFENNTRLLDIANVSYIVKDNKALFTIYTYFLIR